MEAKLHANAKASRQPMILLIEDEELS